MGQAIMSVFHKRFSVNLGETTAPSKLWTKGKKNLAPGGDACQPILEPKESGRVVVILIH